MPVERRFGITCRSPLLDLPNFDIIYDVPLDEFHLIKEGIIRRMLSAMFVDTTHRDSKEILRRLSRCWEVLKVFSESARRTDKLRIPQLKGSELGVMGYTVFPHLAMNLMSGGIYNKEPW